MLGIIHCDRDGAPAFVFDIMEPERRKVDRASGLRRFAEIAVFRSCCPHQQNRHDLLAGADRRQRAFRMSESRGEETREGAEAGTLLQCCFASEMTGVDGYC
jgi:hypothetical protein